MGQSSAGDDAVRRCDFTVSVNMLLGMARRHWQLSPAAGFVVHCDNILTETDPDRLCFTLRPESQRGIRADIYLYFYNSAPTSGL